MVRVKICGVTTPEALQAAALAGADWVGFVFFPPSPRFLSPKQAAALSASHPDGPARVGLFVNPAESDIAAVLAEMPLDVLQILSPPERAASLRARFGLPVWSVTGVQSRADLPQSLPGVDAVLLDAKAPSDSVLPGGNALSFDWSVLRGWTSPAPWLLAGGLTPGNVAEAIRISGAPAVDVSSGVERARGIKDPALIRAFIAASRSSPAS